MVSTCARGTYRDLYAQDYNEQTPDFSRCSRPLTHSMPAIAFTPEMALVLAILGATVALFVFDLLRTDIAALCILLSIGLSSRLPGLEPLVPPEALFSGFSSNAVIAIIAVMIIGAGLDRTGVMRRVSEQILRYGGQSEARLMVLISAATALLSCFVQNVAAAALFLPVVSRICQRTGIPVSRMMMPMGFAAILGGLGTTIGFSFFRVSARFRLDGSRHPLVLVDRLAREKQQRGHNRAARASRIRVRGARLWHQGRTCRGPDRTR